MKLSRYAAVAALLLSSSGAARATVLTEDPLSGDSLSIGATARSFNYVMDGGLLDAPGMDPNAATIGVSLTDLRLRGELKRGDWLTIALHDSLTLTTSSFSLAESGGPLALGQGRLPATWLPLDWSIEDGPQLSLHDRIDWGYARITKGAISLTVGRQPVTFGRGSLWTPEDIVDPFSPVQIDTEFKPGVDAARVDVTFGTHVTLAVLGVAGDTRDAHDLAIRKDGSSAIQRLEVSLGTTRLGLMTGYVRGDAFGALDLFVDLGGADLHGEVTGTYVPDASRRPFEREVFGRAVLGSTFQLSSRLTGTIEGYWNGSGTTHPSQYEEVLSSPRLASGETYNLGVLYGGAVADLTLHALVHVAAAAIVNVIDGSALLAPSVHFNASTNTQLIAGAFFTVGKAPDFSGGSIARSEFALYPNLFHFDLKAYF
ncbi:MAG: hypothetical protein ABI678_18100 [Kofleriaceae bacterium]